MAYSKVVDVDGHIEEPADLWENYLEDRYKDKAIRVRKTEDGLEYLEIAGRRHRSLLPGTMGSLGGIDWENRTQYTVPGDYAYRDACPPGSYDPHERIKVMDQEGIDVALLYPTIGICWEGPGLDDDPVLGPALAAAYCRAYNNWLLDFCKPYPDRLIPIAHISLLDVNEAVVEMKRSAKLGARGFFIRPDLFNGRNVGDPIYDPIWAEAQDMGLPVAPHVVVREYLPLDEWFSFSTFSSSEGSRSYKGENSNFVFAQYFFMLPVQAALTAVVTSGVFDRFPRLKYVVLESGSGWIAYWLERMDSKFEVFGGLSRLKDKPSTYFQRQCWISAEPDEKTIPAMVQLVGEDKFLWASDYPHIDAHYGVVEELRGNIRSLPESAQRKILGENAAQVYGLAT